MGLKEFKEPKIEHINLGDNDIISTSGNCFDDKHHNDDNNPNNNRYRWYR